MVYNVGSHDLPLGEIGTKVNDNAYHIVRFQRKFGNATLQLDDYNVQTVHPQGERMTPFSPRTTLLVLYTLHIHNYLNNNTFINLYSKTMRRESIDLV